MRLVRGERRTEETRLVIMKIPYRTITSTLAQTWGQPLIAKDSEQIYIKKNKNIFILLQACTHTTWQNVPFSAHQRSLYLLAFSISLLKPALAAPRPAGFCQTAHCSVLRACNTWNPVVPKGQTLVRRGVQDKKKSFSFCQFLTGIWVVYVCAGLLSKILQDGNVFKKT